MKSNTQPTPSNHISPYQNILNRYLSYRSSILTSKCTKTSPYKILSHLIESNQNLAHHTRSVLSTTCQTTFLTTKFVKALPYKTITARAITYRISTNITVSKHNSPDHSLTEPTRSNRYPCLKIRDLTLI